LGREKSDFLVFSANCFFVFLFFSLHFTKMAALKREYLFLCVVILCCLSLCIGIPQIRNSKSGNPAKKQLFPSFFTSLSLTRTAQNPLNRRKSHSLEAKWLVKDDDEDDNEDDIDDDEDKISDETKAFEVTEVDFEEAVHEDYSPDSRSTNAIKVKKQKRSNGNNGGNAPSDGNHDENANHEFHSSNHHAHHKHNQHQSPIDPEQEKQNKQDLALIKSIWKEEFLELPPSSEVLQQLLKEDCFTLNNHNRQNATNNLDSFYKQLLHQLLDPLHHQQQQQSSAGKKKLLWLDEEFALKLKGTALLSLHPQLAHTFTGLYSSKLSRSIRLSSNRTNPSVPSASFGLSFLQRVVGRSLAHSLRASFVTVNQTTLESVQRRALEKGIKNQKLLTKATLLSCLMDLSDEQQQQNNDNNNKNNIESSSSASPLVILFDDPLTWLTDNLAASSTVLEELKNDKSRVFFLWIDPQEELKVGQTPPSLQPQKSSAATTKGENGNNNGNNFDSDEMNGGGGPGGGFPPNFNELFNSLSQSFPPPGGGQRNGGPGLALPFFPAPSPHLLPPGGSGTVVPEAFHVIVENGSFTAFPVSPPGMASNGNAPFLRPIRATLRPFPTMTTHEEIQEFLSNEDNRRKLTVRIFFYPFLFFFLIVVLLSIG
jgi:hypothetical protein